MEGNDLHARLDELAQAVEAKVIGWRHHLHAHPELSNREVNTARYVADRLERLGLDGVRTGIAGHGVVGVLRGGRGEGRVMALRADIDALPVRETSGVEFVSTVVDADYPGGPFPVAHACGHDTHTAMLMGAAEVLAQVRDDLPGTVLFVFQPAEEGPPLGEDGGARAMITEGALDDPSPSMVFGMHIAPTPLNTVAYRAGVQYAASSVLEITVTGEQVHGSTPWLGIDPMPVAAEIITAMGQIYRQVPATDPLTISIGHVSDVGRFNIIGGRITLLGTVRCLSQATMERAEAAIERTVRHIALAYGAEAGTRFRQPVPAVHNAPEWVDAALGTLRRVAGADRVFECPPTLGYDDVSEFVNRYGGLYVMLGGQDSRLNAEGTGIEPVPGGRGVVPNHHPAFYADDAALLTGVRLHLHVTADHLAGALVPGTT
ncbi:M20 metallopeptidase family protein [Prescottella subtropica]|uniref:M20 metallopeptidase family protein n=1 Tax=Prescottella subtropica TaxID=2545757 RepID=UPI0010F8103C|nr:amidohydrolase [Prescottella subtropica]